MRSERKAPRGDEGFSIMEVLVSLAVLGTAMAAMGPYFVGSIQTVSHQRASQAAVELVNSAIEQVRAVRGSSLLSGRGKSASTDQWNLAPDVVKPYLAATQFASDPEITDDTSPLGPDAPIPTVPQRLTIGGITYTRNIYIGKCDVYLGKKGTSGACVNPATQSPPDTDATKDLLFFRVIVLVTWPDAECNPKAADASKGVCSSIGSTTIARGSEPTFDVHRPAPLIKTKTMTLYQNVAANDQIEATGGQLPNTWTAVNGTLPTGTSLSPAGFVTGTPSAAGSWAAMITVKDKMGRTDTETVVITVVAPPSLAQPAAAASHVGDTVSQQLNATGGVPPYKYTATGLPTGLTVSSTGAVTGTPTTAGVYPVTAKVTDANGGTSQKTYTHTIHPAVALATIADQTVTLASLFNAATSGSGGGATLSYSATGLPTGVTINPATGVLAGLPTVSGRFLPKVTVTDGLGGAGGTAVRTFQMIVNTSASLIFTAPSFATADRTSAVGAATSVTFTTNGSLLGLSPVLTATGVPPGLTFSAATRTISGVPTTAGVYTVTVQANGLAQYSNLTFVWTIT